MIDKLKQAVNTAYNIEKIHTEIEKSNNLISEFVNKSSTLSENIDDVHKKQQLEISQTLNSCIELNRELSKLKLDLEKEINEFKVLKTQLRTDIIERVAEDIRKEMNIYIMNVKQNVDKMNEAVKDLKTVSDTTKSTCNMIEQIKEIGKNIKKEDFELTKYAQILEKGDREKVELLRKIDTMEKLVGQRRRENRQREDRKPLY